MMRLFHRILILVSAGAVPLLYGAELKVPAFSYGRNSLPVALKFTEADAPECRSGELSVTDNYTGNILHRKKIQAAGNGETSVSFPVPFGSYTVRYQSLSPSFHPHAIAQIMTTGCDRYRSDAERRYEFRYGPVGGCVDRTTPEESERLGRRWVRFEFPKWATNEPAPGNYDFSKVLASIKQHTAANVRLETLACTYHAPPFYRKDNLPGFASGYGHYLQAFAQATRGMVDTHELSNEGNGGDKFIYTEIARHGASGIRSRQPFATIEISGTAQIDYNWLNLQLGRGLFDTVDVFVVHPYTNNSTCSEQVSYEQTNTLRELDALHNLVFSAGGFREVRQTEFGWPNGGLQEERARSALYVRSLILADAAELLTQVVYNWNRDYNTGQQPAGVALHHFARSRQGARFVGLHIDSARQIYTAVYDRFGDAFAIQWTPAEGSRRPTVSGSSCQDMFGNPIPPEKVRISRTPTTFNGIPRKVVMLAAEARVKKLAARFQDFLQRNPRPAFKAFRSIQATDTPGLRRALLALMEHLPDGTGLSRVDAALLHSALCWYLAAVWNFPDNATELQQADPAPFLRQIEEGNRQLLDRPALRYVLRQMDRFALQLPLCRDELNRTACRSALDMLQRTALFLSKRGEVVQYAVFTNLYQKDGSGKLTERLVFPANVPVKTKFQVSNYSDRQQQVTVRPLLPPGWQGKPAEVTVPAGGSSWGELTLTASSTGGANSIAISTEISGKPARITRFDNFECPPAIGLTIPLLHERPGKLPLKFFNREKKMARGKVKLTPGGIGGDALAIVPIKIPAQSEWATAVTLAPEKARKLAGADYKVDACFLLTDGRVFDVKGLNVDFGTATRRMKDGAIDGKLDDWKNALPLRLDREEYTLGSYGGSWTPDDCSAITFLAWDSQKLYFAAEVRDQAFSQTRSDFRCWQEDSVQLLLTANPDETDPKKIEALLFALTPEGPRAWWEHPVPQGDNRSFIYKLLDDCELAITYRNNRFLYEFAIPWQKLGRDFVEVPKRGRFGFAVAVNDHDVLTSRRYMERFPGSVIDGRRLNAFADAWCEQDSPSVEKPAARVVFEENFEDSTMTGYRHIHTSSRNCSRVVGGAGENHSNAMHLTHNGEKGVCKYSVPLTLTPGKKYRVDFRLKGKNCSAPRLGCCSDINGWYDQKYVKLPPEIPRWTTFSREFTAPLAGSLRLMIACSNKTEELWIDHIRIVELQ